MYTYLHVVIVYPLVQFNPYNECILTNVSPVFLLLSSCMHACFKACMESLEVTLVTVDIPVVVENRYMSVV